MNPVIGNLPLQRLEPQHVRAVLDVIHDRGLSNKTASLAHSALRRSLTDAVDDGLLVVNPASRVRAPRVRRKAAPMWGAEEIDRFLRAAATNQFVEFFELAILTGLRRSEIAGLRWANVNLESKTLRVVETLQRVESQSLLRTTHPSVKREILCCTLMRVILLLKKIL